MNNNTEYNIFLFLNFNRFTIVVLNEKDEVIYKKETTIKNSSNKIELDVFSEFLNQNIFKIEKEINEFIETVHIIIDHDDIFSINLSIKNKIDNVLLNTNTINDLLLEAKNCCKETFINNEVIHFKIDQFLIDNCNFVTLPNKHMCKDLSIDLSIICVPKNILKDLEKILGKFQISLGKIFCYKYLNSFPEAKDMNFYEIAQKAKNGLNENDVILTDKTLKNSGFFEKFFNFFN
tara:strand:- start:30 stop:731 length:702 start_codon:yes stop_codon:yes gene_type:complete